METHGTKKEFNLEDFVYKFQSITPLEEDLLNTGISANLSKEFMGNFSFKKKKNESIFSNKILQLIDQYDTSTFDICDVTFNNEIQETNQYYIFGRYDGQDLILDKSTDEIKWKEYGIEHILAVCAINGESFLEALYCAALHITKTMTNKVAWDDQQERCSTAHICGIVAGGDKYEGFYCNMLGCFE